MVEQETGYRVPVYGGGGQPKMVDAGDFAQQLFEAQQWYENAAGVKVSDRKREESDVQAPVESQQVAPGLFERPGDEVVTVFEGGRPVRKRVNQV